MKTIKKCGVILLALAMLMSLATVAMAAGAHDPEGATKENVNVKVPTEGPAADHKYVAYQIFKGTQDINEVDDDNKVVPDNQKLASIEWAAALMTLHS